MLERCDSMEQRVAKLEADMVDVKTRLAVAESNIKDMREDISAIKNNTTWILRLIIGAIIASLLGLVLKTGGM
ncbi:hemolysin XhlA family protein [Parageobacillus thermoglucosidasius]|uniref:hemolysin XhlA family protein n=1 Tax=Parageobacillus thermoglucosidasius TaxID=1426 RepID=UPI00227732C3|nr:hemolysin XhlA family protein [Parageobacillus thermoglucosidasius]